jgi:putative oxidoreductase
MNAKLFNTTPDWTPFILRVILGGVVFAHGAQKLFGWFGGYGFNGTMVFFTDTVGLPWIVGFTVIMLEAIGSIVLVSGLATRLMALSYTLLGIGILFTSHVKNGFFMNWFGNQPGEGIEFFLLWLAISTTLIITGGGRLSLDQHFIKK